jgi:4-amino-4-deoxy-L-arabinose transferase-like glycosyltransferase
MNVMSARVEWKQGPIIPLLLVVVINIAWFAVFPSIGGRVGADTGTDGYKEIAENLVQGRGFIYSPDKPSTMMLGYIKREPVYPLMLSGVLVLSGALTPAVMCLFQTSLSVLSCLLLFRLGERVFGWRTGLVASYMYALHPISFWYASRFASETAAIPVLLLCLLIVDKFLEAPTHLRSAGLGWSLGIAALTKSAYVIVLPIALVVAAFRWRHRLRRIWPAALIATLCYASVHSVWLARNYRMSGEIVPFTTMNGVAFLLGNRIVETFDPKRQTAGREVDTWANDLYQSVQGEIAAKHPDMSLARLEVQTDRELTTMGRERVFKEPGFVVRKVLTGLVFIWFLSDTTAKSLGWAICQLPVLAFAIFGASRLRFWTPPAALLLGVIAVFILAYTVVSPLARYSTPVLPLVMLFASQGVLSMVAAARVSRGQLLASS